MTALSILDKCGHLIQLVWQENLAKGDAKQYVSGSRKYAQYVIQTIKDNRQI